jgi:RluA family pseudouridine synthase
VLKLSSPATREVWEIAVLAEDEHLLALGKPAGLLTSPDRDDPARPNLMKLLHAGIAEGKAWARERGLQYLMNAHRLDFETSGVLLLAKSKPVLVALANLFGSDKPRKTYVALVQGLCREEAFAVDAPLGPHPIRPGLMRVDRQHGKRSFTSFDVAERFDGYTLLRCQPRTSRTHQIRVHLRSARLPIVADAAYGGRLLLLSRLKQHYHLKPGHTERPLLAMAALHAEKLELPHPVTAQPWSAEAPWPKDLQVAVKYLRRYAPLKGPGFPGPAAPHPDPRVAG